MAKRLDDAYDPRVRWLKIENPDYAQKKGESGATQQVEGENTLISVTKLRRLTSSLSIRWFCFEIPQRCLVPRRFDLLVHAQYGIVGGFNRTLDERALQDCNAFAVDLLFHQG